MPRIQILDQCWIKGRNTLFIGSGHTVMIHMDPVPVKYDSDPDEYDPDKDKYDPDPAQMINFE